MTIRSSVVVAGCALMVLSGCSSSDETTTVNNAAIDGQTQNADKPDVYYTSSPSPAAREKINIGIGTPVSLMALSINVMRPIEAIGQAPDGSLSPKQNQVGWYSATPAPGKVGHTVLLAHDTYNGAQDVFANLKSLKKGDRISVYTSTKKMLNYDVTFGPISIDKDAAQHDQRIWGPTSDDMLVLVTCDIDSGFESAIHHKNNTIVWAKRVK